MDYKKYLMTEAKRPLKDKELFRTLADIEKTNPDVAALINNAKKLLLDVAGHSDKHDLEWQRVNIKLIKKLKGKSRRSWDKINKSTTNFFNRR